MHVLSRLLRASSGATLPDAISRVNTVLGLINENHGSQFSAGIAIGGDAQVIAITGAFESLGDYETLRAAVLADQEVQTAIQAGADLFDNTVEDTLWKVRIQAGDQDAITVVNSVRVQLTRIGDAMTFASEVASTVQELTGTTVGMATAMTGDQSRLVWVGYGPSLAQLEENIDTLEASDQYLDLFKRSEGLLVPNTLEQSIWQRITE